MREKDDGTKQKILECAKAEFMEKGYADASMRSIAERVGCTTGMLYSRFADKGELFGELVSGPADRLYRCFREMQEEFATFDADVQRREMHTYVEDKIGNFIDLLYEDFDAFKLVVCKSTGSDWQFYIEKMIDIETKHTFRFINLMRENGFEIGEIRKDLAHMLSTALFNGIFEVIRHDLAKEDATGYIRQVQEFFNAGWDRLLGL